MAVNLILNCNGDYDNAAAEIKPAMLTLAKLKHKKFSIKKIKDQAT